MFAGSSNIVVVGKVILEASLQTPGLVVVILLLLHVHHQGH